MEAPILTLAASCIGICKMVPYPLLQSQHLRPRRSPPEEARHAPKLLKSPVNITAQQQKIP